MAGFFVRGRIGGMLSSRAFVKGVAMRPQDWFLVAVKVLGAYIFWCAAVRVGGFLQVLLGLMPSYLVDKDYGGSSEKAASLHLLYAATDLAVAAYFLLGTKGLTAWVFGEGTHADE